MPNHLNASRRGFPLCSPAYNRRKVKHIWVIGISVGIVIVAIVLCLKRWFHNDRAMMEHEDTLSSSVFSFDVKIFQRVSFDHREIIQSMIDKNLLAYGGSGTVYKIACRIVAVVAL